jgi:uncharacterized protein (DUF302 family)
MPQWVLALLLAISPAAWSAAEDPVVRHALAGEFKEVRDAVEMALTGRGLVVSGVSYVGEMLERTGKDLGAARQIYLDAEVIEFCSAVISRNMMEADPHTVVFCPYQIALYVLPEEPDTVYLAYRRPGPGTTEASRRALAEVEALLEGIIEDAKW